MKAASSYGSRVGLNSWEYMVLGAIITFVAGISIGNGLSSFFDGLSNPDHYGDGTDALVAGSLLGVVGQILLLIGVIAQGVKVGLRRDL